MPRTETTRRQYGSNNEHCPGDVTDEDRAVVFPPLPGPDTLGRPRQVALRDVWDGIDSIAAAGCVWCPLPKAFPPVSTVRSCFHNRRDSGLPAQINHAAVAPAGERDARDHRPRAGVMDSQGVKTTGNGGISGDDAGKGIKGRKRHIMTDTLWPSGGIMRSRCQHSGSRRGSGHLSRAQAGCPGTAPRFCRLR